MIFIIKNNFFRFLFFPIIGLIFFSSCEKSDSANDKSSLEINFKHFVDDSEIIYSVDNMTYQNVAGNMYSVRRLLYVISDIILYFPDNLPIALDRFIFVNSEDPETLLAEIDNLPELCSGISFRLGFSYEDNIDLEYINAENQFHDNMIWPNSFGVNLAFQGGYHYMKLEGKYLNDFENQVFYNNHTGPTNGADYSVLYSEFNFTSSESIMIKMNINNFYNNPIYDMNLFGVAIMENMDAQIQINENGLDVFTVETN